MSTQNLTLHFDELESNESMFLATFLGLMSVKMGISLAIKYIERNSATRNILGVWVNQTHEASDISRMPLRMAYQNYPVHIKSIDSLLSTSIKCVDVVLRSTKGIDIPKVAAILRECGYDFDIAESMSNKDASSKKKAIVAFLTAVVAGASMIAGGGTVEGTTCATIAIGLVASRTIDAKDTAMSLAYGEVGIRTAKDIDALCKKWITVYDAMKKMQTTKFEMTTLEHRVVNKIVYTLGETLRFTGMALRSYASRIR